MVRTRFVAERQNTVNKDQRNFQTDEFPIALNVDQNKV